VFLLCLCSCYVCPPILLALFVFSILFYVISLWLFFPFIIRHSNFNDHWFLRSLFQLFVFILLFLQFYFVRFFCLTPTPPLLTYITALLRATSSYWFPPSPSHPPTSVHPYHFPSVYYNSNPCVEAAVPPECFQTI
jgi:hypothetical protein